MFAQLAGAIVLIINSLQGLTSASNSIVYVSFSRKQDGMGYLLVSLISRASQTVPRISAL